MEQVLESVVGVVRLRWIPALLALGAALLLGACSGESGPLDERGRDLELAGKATNCDTAPAPIPALVNAQFSGGNRNAVRARCANILRKAPSDRTTALQMAIDLAGYIQQHSKGSDAQKVSLINAFLCASQQQSPTSGSCDFQLPPEVATTPGAAYRVVGPEGGGPFFADDGKIGYQLQPGWSTGPRIVFNIPGPCQVVSPFPVFPECARHGTVPDGPFASPGTGVLAHCAQVPDGTDLADLRLARNIDDFNDPDATDDGSSEHYPDFPPPFALAGCVATPGPSVAAQNDARSSSGAGLAGGKAGGTGAALADTRKTVGGQISSFSEWAVVEVGTEPTTIEGQVLNGTAPFSGVTVDLACDDDISAEQTTASTVSDEGGFYSFDSASGFAPGSTCILNAFESTEGGSYFGSVDRFTVEPGPNVKDIQMTFSGY